MCLGASKSSTNRTGNAGINVIWKRVRVTSIAVKKQKVLHILSVRCSPNYLARYAQAPYYIFLCSLSDSDIFPFYFINSTFYGKTLLNIKCAF
jgi:hypothetical protein